MSVIKLFWVWGLEGIKVDSLFKTLNFKFRENYNLV